MMNRLGRLIKTIGNMQKNLKLRSLAPIALILVCMLIAYVFTYYYSFSWKDFQDWHLALISFQKQHSILTPLLFISLYIFYALLSLPGIFVLSLIAGYLFKQPFSTLYVLLAATIGASLLFLAIRIAYRHFFYKKTSPLLANMKIGFEKNAAHYLLFLRLVPLSPFGLINVASACLNVPFSTFIWTTFIGMIPSVIIYTQLGRELATLIESQEPLTITYLLNPQLIGTLTCLALISLLPVFFKSYKIRS